MLTAALLAQVVHGVRDCYVEWKSPLRIYPLSGLRHGHVRVLLLE
jgi:hypothetical protein